MVNLQFIQTGKLLNQSDDLALLKKEWKRRINEIEQKEIPITEPVPDGWEFIKEYSSKKTQIISREKKLVPT